MTRIWLIQSVLSPYRIPLFQRIAETPGIDLRLILLSDRFRTRREWKRDLSTLPFKVEVPFGFGYQTGPEHEYCINPFLLGKMLRDRPDVVLCGGYSLATLNALLYQRVFGGRYVIWTEATMLSDGGIKGLRLWLRRLMAKSASAIVDAGTWARDYVRFLMPRIPAEKLFRAYNCVDNPQFMKSPEEGRRFLAAQNLPAQNLLFVGKLNERKGILELLEVYRRITNERKELGLILVGDGPLLPHIEEFKSRHALSHLRLPGFVKNEDTASYYAGASAFVLLSRIDHNPLVLFEALASGVPIICSNRAGNAVDFIENEVNGYIVDPLNIEEVVKKVEAVLAWDEVRRLACARFSKEVVQKANYEDAAKAFVAACHHSVGPVRGGLVGQNPLNEPR